MKDSNKNNEKKVNQGSAEQNIRLKDALACYNNAILKEKLNDIQGALADYDQAISLDPKLAEAYNSRALLKNTELNDIQGALVDYNQAIFLNPKDSKALGNRANVKAYELNDIQGALADYNQAISITPKDSIAYCNRANLKKRKLNDRAGAIKDYRQAAKLFRQSRQTQYLQMAMDRLKELGATE
jgi:tetratricopeptide (TPR) repeat protein